MQRAWAVAQGEGVYRARRVPPAFFDAIAEDEQQVAGMAFRANAARFAARKRRG